MLLFHRAKEHLSNHASLVLLGLNDSYVSSPRKRFMDMRSDQRIDLGGGKNEEVTRERPQISSTLT